MDASFFISRRLRFRRRIVTASIAVSFLVMILAVAISSGFRYEIREGISSVAGDIQLTPPDQNVLDETSPVEANPEYLASIRQIEGVESIYPVVYRAGIVKNGDNIHGVLFKGTAGGPENVSGQEVPDTVALPVSIPRRLSEITSLKEGDRMLAYFVGEKVKMRRFNVVSVYDMIVEADDNLVVIAEMSDLQRLMGWSDKESSAIEIVLAPSYKDEETIKDITMTVGTVVNAYSEDSEYPVIATSSLSRFPQIFDWLDLIDFNVFFILMLMTIVAGFNMISGLLIMLFENISTIGLLKALGMTDKAIAKVFLSSSSVLVGKGMLAGNALALVFCIVQGKTGLIPLDPENYFVSNVPVHLDLGWILAADVTAFVIIMLLLLIPCIFISKVDPADTVRVR
jgi:lipoprotein-releasing system permease protein